MPLANDTGKTTSSAAYVFPAGPPHMANEPSPSAAINKPKILASLGWLLDVLLASTAHIWPFLRVTAMGRYRQQGPSLL